MLVVPMCAKCGDQPVVVTAKGRVWLFCRACSEIVEKLIKESKADG